MENLKWRQATGERQIGLYSGLPIAIIYPPDKDRAYWKAEAVMPGCQAYICHVDNEEMAKERAEKFVSDWLAFPRFQYLQTVEYTEKIAVNA